MRNNLPKENIENPTGFPVAIFHTDSYHMKIKISYLIQNPKEALFKSYWNNNFFKKLFYSGRKFQNILLIFFLSN